MRGRPNGVRTGADYARAMSGGSEAPTLLSFVIPVLDEIDGISVLWDALCTSGEQLVAEGRIDAWEAVIVDDGSTDGSGAALDALAEKDARCCVVHHEANVGLGQALRTGFGAARGDLLVYTDADLPFDLRALGSLLDPVITGATDMVSGRRIGRAREGRWRAVQSVAYNTLVRVVFNLPMADVNFACKVLHRRALAPTLTSKSGFIDAEWLVWARREGLRIRQVPVEFTPRQWGASTLGGAGEIADLLGELARHRWHLWRQGLARAGRHRG
ncbi:MAG: glycosyl transferase family 2 [Acidimicrobiales bacterium]|nr:glycosyl transferase family 2 [Acidimicrobiales bacterium]